MGYEKEIILIKNPKFVNFSALDLIETLKGNDWKTTLALIDQGNDFDWISLTQNKEGQAEFNQILQDKWNLNEYIGFTLRHTFNDRFVAVNMDKTTICFSLDIDRTENELHWFEWYMENLITTSNGLIEKVLRIEWRTGYEKEIIRLIKLN